MKKKRTTGKRDNSATIGNITDSGYIDVKDAPIIYAYIYERENADLKRFLKNYKNVDIEKNDRKISGFSFVNGKIEPTD